MAEAIDVYGSIYQNLIGTVGICGLSGMAITAAGTDTRIKAVATFSMYDMSRDMSKGHMDYYTEEQRNKIKEYLSRQRWKDAENGTFALGNHEIAFDENNEPITGMVAGENAHSRYYSEDAYAAASEPKELVIVPDADHVDLYDNMEKIPFDKLEQFFKENMK